MFRNIVVATDGSELAVKAVGQAGDLARTHGAKLTIVTVTAQAPVFDDSEIGWTVPASAFDAIRRANTEKGRAILRAAVAATGVDAEAIQVENERPYEGILEAAKTAGADLIVMGSHGRRGFDRLLLGSQAAKILSLAPVSVLIVKF